MNESYLKSCAASDFANKILDVLNDKGNISIDEFLTVYIEYQKSQGVIVTSADDEDEEEENI
jgi:hypothetical protein